MAVYNYYSPRPSVFPQIIAALFGGMFLFFCAVAAWVVGYQLVYAGRIFPGVSVAGVDLSGMTPSEAALKLSQTLSYPMTGKVVFRDGNRFWVATPVELGMVFDPTASANTAYQIGRAGDPFTALAGQIRARADGVDAPPVLILDQRVTYQYLQNLASQVNQPLTEATLQLQGSNIVAISGQVGRILNLDATIIYLGAQLQSFRDGESPLVIQEAKPLVMDVSAQADVARSMLSQPMQLVLPNHKDGDPGPWVYDAQAIASMLTARAVDRNGQVQVELALEQGALRQLLTNIAPQIAREPQDARFRFNDATYQLESVAPSKNGLTLDVEASIVAINDALLRGEHVIPLVVVEKQPILADTATGADLGIVENIMTYTTYFYHSSEARMQNIKTASAQFDGLLVAPGETFSMGKGLGDVSLDNGYAEALIIYGNRTIKGVGGGVCQVSTTLFRTVFMAGFPIVERHSHAYRVSYYELTSSGAVDPNLAGLDATVYFPLVDFKFTNDTPYWVLMETYFNASARSLTWKLYSTSDARSITWETTGPQNITPPPPPIFEENPALEPNEIREADYPSNGADVNVMRTVWRNGQIYFTDSFQTHYEAWGAVCQYGTGTEDPQKLARKKGICFAP